MFYAFSLSSVIPLLKILFAEHETLTDWLNRTQAESRLLVRFPADLPDDPRGALVVSADNRDSRSSARLEIGDRIVLFNGGGGSSYELIRRMAIAPGNVPIAITVESPGGTRRVMERTLQNQSIWFKLAGRVAGWLPPGSDPDARLRMLMIVMAFFVLLTLLGGIFRFINEGLIAVAVQRGLHDMRTALANCVLHLPIDWHSRQPHGDTLSRFATDLNRVEVGIMTLFGKTVREPIKAVGVLVLALIIDWRLLVGALIGLPIAVVVFRSFGQIVKRAQRRASESWGRLLDHLGERLIGIRIVKACNMQDAESARFEREGTILTRAQTHIELVDAATNPVLEIIAMIAVAAFVLYGGSRVFQRELEPHLFFAALVCLVGMFDPVRKLGNVFNRMQAADASAGRLFEYLDLPAEEPQRASTGMPPKLPTMREGLEFRGVWFAYPSNPDRPVLADINLQVRRGEMIALVGPNGSGKTTLMALLLRFFEPTRGDIRIDGCNIGQCGLDSLRSQIGLVTQDPIIFSDTVRANIAYGANGVSDEVVRQAARLAHADDFAGALRVERDGVVTIGYDAQVSGRTLSGGQKQRIALARAILRDPPILILDEATSQIDTESERKIQEAFDDVTRNRTTFIIAHRFSTIAKADRIVVLDAGRIVGVGKHSDLIQNCPTYANLCRTQFAQVADA